MPSLLIIADENAPEEHILASKRVLAKYYRADFLRAHPTNLTGAPTPEQLADAACIVFSSPEMFLRLAGLPDIATRNIAIADTLLDCVSMNQYHDGQRKAVSVLAPLIAASLAAAGTPSNADAEELQKLRRYYAEVTEFLGTDNVFGVVGALRAQIAAQPALEKSTLGMVNPETQEQNFQSNAPFSPEEMDLIINPPWIETNPEQQKIVSEDPIVADLAAEMAGAESLDVPDVMDTLKKSRKSKK